MSSVSPAASPKPQIEYGKNDKNEATAFIRMGIKPENEVQITKFHSSMIHGSDNQNRESVPSVDSKEIVLDDL